MPSSCHEAWTERQPCQARVPCRGLPGSQLAEVLLSFGCFALEDQAHKKQSATTKAAALTQAATEFKKKCKKNSDHDFHIQAPHPVQARICTQALHWCLPAGLQGAVRQLNHYQVLHLDFHGAVQPTKKKPKMKQSKQVL